MSEIHSFKEIATILGVSTVFGILGQKLRQPLIIMFLAAGIACGPSAFGVVQSHAQIELLAQIGIAILLFIVGLKLDLDLIRTTGPVALATGIGQIVFTSLFGFLIALAFGMNTLTSAYVSVALTFSSTIIIVKLLSDKREIDSLHGQIAIGFLIVQDVAAILALVALTAIGSATTSTPEGGASIYSKLIGIAFEGLAMLIVTGVLMRFVLPALTRRLAHSMELLTLFAIAWAVSFGAASEALGFSKEVGAFLAGVSLASTDYRDSIGVRLNSLRDFLLLFFFIDLGARLEWASVGSQVFASGVFSIFVLVGNPLIVIAIMGFMGYRRRTSLLSGLAVAQISEFSLILVALGLSLGHINKEAVGLVTLVGVVTIFLSTYMILYSSKLYEFLSEPLKIFERDNPYRERLIETNLGHESIDVILFGLGNYGAALATVLLRRKKSLLGVDFDPAALDRMRSQGIRVVYGDMGDSELSEQIPLNKARWVISSIRSLEHNSILIKNLIHLGFNGKIAVTAQSEAEAAVFQKLGVDLVFRPLQDATEQAADSLTYAMDFLPDKVHWPINFVEIRIRSDAAAVGKTIAELALSSSGASILAISRGGRLIHDPEPNFRIVPSDRVLLMGSALALERCSTILDQAASSDASSGEGFGLSELKIGEKSAISGQSLVDLKFRQRFGVTLVGIQRGSEKITTIDPKAPLQNGDVLIVVGKAAAIRELATQAQWFAPKDDEKPPEPSAQGLLGN